VAAHLSSRRRALRDTLVLLIVLGGLAFLVLRPDPEPAETGRGCDPPAKIRVAGAKLPSSCRIEPFEGGFASLAELQDGRPLVLNFWASWCRSCIEEMPGYQRVYAAARGRVRLVGVDVIGTFQGQGGETRHAGREFARRLAVRYPLAFDEDWLLYQHFSKQPALPATLFVQPDGTIVHTQLGPLSPEALTEAIRTHLGVDVRA
jgi:thiol-disulfide isomerase/thioredoxin